MSFVEAIVLGIVQGLTEFLPISSTGHLVLASWLLDWDDPGLELDVTVHAGTLAAVLLYFRREWAAMARGVLSGGAVTEPGPAGDSWNQRRMLVLLAIGTVPLGIVGLITYEQLGGGLRTPTSVGWLLMGTGVALAVGELFGRRLRRLGDLGVRDAGAVGLAQALAVLPGVSRSGVTIVAGLLGNMTRETAARFSFLLATPAILGASVVQAGDWWVGRATADLEWGPLAVAAVMSFVASLAAIRGLMTLLQRGSLRPFVAYCLVAGAAVVAARAAGL
ncbi:MAG: undecaprenyl-diphosphate phosphatase [Dehalococcoidia bacterium]